MAGRGSQASQPSDHRPACGGRTAGDSRAAAAGAHPTQSPPSWRSPPAGPWPPCPPSASCRQAGRQAGSQTGRSRCGKRQAGRQGASRRGRWRRLKEAWSLRRCHTVGKRASGIPAPIASPRPPPPFLPTTTTHTHMLLNQRQPPPPLRATRLAAVGAVAVAPAPRAAPARPRIHLLHPLLVAVLQAPFGAGRVQAS